MSSTVWFTAASILLCALALVGWAWLAMAKVKKELRAFAGFEGMHFEA